MPAAKNPPKKRIADTPAQSRRPRPTATLPRSPERIEELRRRAQRHESIFDRRDTDLDERRGLRVQVLCNGFPVATGIAFEENLPAEHRKWGSSGHSGFGARLAFFRRGKGWSQIEMARRCGLAREHLCRLEGGGKQPGLSALLALADVLELDLDRLAGRTPPTASESLLPDSQKELPGRLRAMRCEKNWSHEQLARRAGLDKRHIAKLERGKRQPGLSALLALADAFKLSLDGLIGRTPPAA